MTPIFVALAIAGTAYISACAGKALSQPNDFCVKFFCWREDKSVRLGFCEKHLAKWVIKSQNRMNDNE